MASRPDAPPDGVSHGAAAICACRHGVAQDTVLEGIVANLALAVPVGKGCGVQIEIELMPGPVDRHFAEVSAGAQYRLTIFVRRAFGFVAAGERGAVFPEDLEAVTAFRIHDEEPP